MHRFCVLFLLAGLLIAGNERGTQAPTFNRDVASILHKRCAECHRAGEVAPMPLITYDESRPWAKAIKERVVSRAMPPWLADPRYGHFENDRRLSEAEIKTIAAWVDAGAPRGDAADRVEPPKFEPGWVLGRPDAVIAMEEDHDVPAEGTIPYKYFTVPTNFTEDKWIQAAEIRPGNRALVHHIIVNVLEPGVADRTAETQREGRRGFKLAGFAPGEQPRVYPAGTAKLVKAGSRFSFQVHYTTNGKAGKDRSYIGLFYARQPVEKKAVTGMAVNATFVIPAGAPDHEVRSSWTAPQDVRILDLMPHMHKRGKDFTYTAVYPNGRSEVVLRVPKYDFNWQLLYNLKEPLLLPKGARLDCVAHFDNSPNNKYNPDAAKEVRWGPQTWEEMMIGWFDYTVENEKIPAAPSGLD
jgi:hypothetical protein